MTERRNRHASRPGRHGRRDPLARALRRLGIGGGIQRTRRPEAPEGPETPADLPGRIGRLEREVQEVRTRINALFFAVLTAALGDLAGRVVLG